MSKSKQSKQHNKKRNVGLVYQQALKKASVALLEGQNSNAKAYLGLLAKHFKEGTELFREYRLFKSILDTNGMSDRDADRVLTLARDISRSINNDRLEMQKSSFISEANKLFGLGELFNTPVENYRALATVQLLLNEWRSPGTLDPQETLQFESRLRSYMLMSEEKENLDIQSDVNELSLRIFEQKFNDAYSNELLPEQKKFLGYVSLDNKEKIEQSISAAKIKALKLLEVRNKIEENNLLREQHKDVIKKIESLDSQAEDSYAKHMTLLKLISELEG